MSLQMYDIQRWLPVASGPGAAYRARSARVSVLRTLPPNKHATGLGPGMCLGPPLETVYDRRAMQSPDDQANAIEGLYCPTCEYLLAGLTEHRCPECGTEFDPDALRPWQLKSPQPVDPWSESGSIGWGRAFGKTWLAVVTSPRRFAAGLPRLPRAVDPGSFQLAESGSLSDSPPRRLSADHHCRRDARRSARIRCGRHIGSRYILVRVDHRRGVPALLQIRGEGSARRSQGMGGIGAVRQCICPNYGWRLGGEPCAQRADGPEWRHVLPAVKKRVNPAV